MAFVCFPKISGLRSSALVESMIFGIVTFIFMASGLVCSAELVNNRIGRNITGKTRMSTEIERKFLVDPSSLPKDIKKHPNSSIIQGYLAVEGKTEIRVRKKGRNFYLTVKTGSGILREEKEIQLTRHNFDKLWPLTKGKRIKKTRYLIPAGENQIELDIYDGRFRGLMTAEVEFSSMKSSGNFQPPAWFGPDISEDDGYKNKNLAVHGIPSLKD
jgi:adenylate cyclase